MNKTWTLIPILMLVLVVSGCTSNGNETNSPTDVYTAYKIEFDNSNNFDDYVNVLIKYANQETIELIDSEELQNIPDEQKNNMFNFVKSMSPTYEELDNIEEEINNDTATLIISLKDGTMNGTVLMVRENGIWKLKEESWS